MHPSTKGLVVAQEVEPNQMELVQVTMAVVELLDKGMLVDRQEQLVQVQEVEGQAVLVAAYLAELVQAE
jgi:hypothetical protein